jgi:hypothetical protein
LYPFIVAIIPVLLFITEAESEKLCLKKTFFYKLCSIVTLVYREKVAYLYDYLMADGQNSQRWFLKVFFL